MNICNKLTVFRIILVPFFVFFMLCLGNYPGDALLRNQQYDRNPCDFWLDEKIREEDY